MLIEFNNNPMMKRFFFLRISLVLIDIVYQGKGKSI
jgi:hypothetical protein